MGLLSVMEPKTAHPLEHGDDNQEVEDLLSLLPKEGDMVASDSYKYQGFWYPLILLKGVIISQKHFMPRENDVFIVTAPKSGSTWMKAILYALMNREAQLPQSPHHPLLHKAPRELVPFLEVLSPSEYDSVCNSPDTNARIFSAHTSVVSLPKSVTSSLSNCKIVYMCRDIKDIFVSLFHFINKSNFRSSPISLEEAFNLYCKGVNAAGPVWDHILGYWIESQKNPHKVLFLRYDEMKNVPKLQLKRLASFLEKPFSEEEENSGLVDEIISLCSFESLTKIDVNKKDNSVKGVSNSSFFRKGVVGDWKNWLTPEMASRLDQITEEKFSGSGLSL
ncbi:cytosolic sulfotransferase 8-like [Apium graveolens]|uniref:cytosolic sulfotransferase 8-like n=1 Tax=Apium graveolens TaxID=4045 RepID=UPI003D7BFF20